MKITQLAAILVVGAVAACSSAPSPAPAPREPRITYSAVKADLKTVIDQIARQGNLSIILDSNIRVSGTVSLSVNEVEPREVLMAVAKTFDLRVTEERPGLYRVSAPE
jgi:type II secretory pathway component GspD/PulD (secretin)